MATNATKLVSERRLEEEAIRSRKVEEDAAIPKNGHGSDADDDRDGAPLATVTGKTAASRPGDESGPELALAPLVDKIAYAFARGLVVAMKELEQHIASETRKVADTVGHRLDDLQASFQDLTDVVSEQRTISLAVQDQCQQLAVATDSLKESGARQQTELLDLRKETREFSKSASDRMEAMNLAVKEELTATAASLEASDGRHQAEVSALRDETRESSKAMSDRVDALCKELGVQQEDIGAIKDALGAFTSRVDTIVERLDRQSEALRSMYTSYSQRETELEHLVEGLARLRAYPAPAPTNGL